jgi:hypothetical protein
VYASCDLWERLRPIVYRRESSGLTTSRSFISRLICARQVVRVICMPFAFSYRPQLSIIQQIVLTLTTTIEEGSADCSCMR